MELLAQSEWMKDQKHAVIMAPGKAFEVIQTSTGQAVFFSLGSDNILYATREVVGSKTGWTKLDLSSGLAANHPGQNVVAKSFCIAQNPESLFFDVVLAVKVGASDHLYMSLGNANTDEFWNDQQGFKFQWQAVPFDAGSRDRLDIEAVYLMNQPNEKSQVGTQTCFVDVVKGARDTVGLNLVQRYYVSLKNEDNTKWQLRTLPIDLHAGSISSCLGRPKNEYVGGIYTLGKLASKPEVIYNPAYNAFDPSIPANPTRFQISKKTTSIAVAMDSQGFSTLFFSTERGIGIFPPDQQREDATPTLILPWSIACQATQLSAETSGGVTAVYGVSVGGDLFYASCAEGYETDPKEWSVPVALVPDIQGFAFFLNKEKGNNTLFAHGYGKDVFQLTQDPVTLDWASRVILLPPADLNHVAEFDAFTTRLTLMNEQQRPAVGETILLNATSPVGVYVNNEYRVLKPDLPTKITTDQSGVVKLSQPTEDSVAICYVATLGSDSTKRLSIDPALKAKTKLNSIKSKKDLDNAQIKNADGTSRPLVPQDVGDKDRNSAVEAIKGLMKAAADLPQDGSVKDQSSAIQAAPATGSVTNIVSIKTTDSGQLEAQSNVLSASDDDIFVRAGDFFRSTLHTVWDELKGFVLRVVNDVYEFVVDIGGKIYRAVLDSLSAVYHALEWVFNKIKVFVEDLIKWLGFIFNWKDIVRTHKVIKNVTKQYARHAIMKIGDLSTGVEGVFENVEDKLNKWAGLPQNSKKMGEIEKSSKTNHSSMDDPQAHYVHDKAESHLPEAEGGSKSPDVESGGWRDILSKLSDFAGKEKDLVVGLVDEIKTQIIIPFADLSLTDIVKRLAGIIGKLVLNTAKNFLVLTLDVLKSVSDGVIDALEEPIKIPVISKLYKWAADEELSILDLVCLAAACPVTIIYKAITNENPFPDDSTTRSLIDAESFSSLQNIITNDFSLLRKFTIVGEFVAMAGLFFDSITNVFKLPHMKKGEPHEVSDNLKQVSLVVKLLVVMPSYLRKRSDSDAWYWKFDALMTDLAVLKTVLDVTTIGEKAVYGKVSPYIDYTISTAWLVPAIGKAVENHQNKNSSWTSLGASLGYDVAVMAAPILWNPNADPETKLAVFAGANGVVAICGAVRVATGGLLHDGD